MRSTQRAARGNVAAPDGPLTATADGAVIWSDKMNGSLEMVFTIQEQVSRKIVDALWIALTPRE